MPLTTDIYTLSLHDALPIYCRDGEEAEYARRAPAPRRPLADADEQGHEPGGQERRARPVDTAGRADRRLRDHELRRDGRRYDRHERQPEEPVVGEVLRDRPGEHDPEPAADAEQRRDEGDAGRHALAGELVPDDRECEREDRAARALDHAA